MIMRKLRIRRMCHVRLLTFEVLRPPLVAVGNAAKIKRDFINIFVTCFHALLMHLICLKRHHFRRRATNEHGGRNLFDSKNNCICKF